MGISIFLHKYYLETPNKVVFNFPNEEKSITYSKFYKDVVLKGNCIQKQFKTNDRLLLLYKDVYEFIVAFVASELVGCVPIPMFPPRNNRNGERLANIIADCQPKAILTSLSQKDKLNADGIEAFVLEDIDGTVHAEFPKYDQAEIAFIQYTSGSTGTPKGVVISNENLIHNLDLMRDQYKIDEDSILYSWLPFYHDMGLVGKLLQTIRSGCTLISVLPNEFIKKPVTWLKAISQYKITHTAAPNFAFDYCVSKIDTAELEDINLNSIVALVNGSEKIHENTINAFAHKFAPFGFNKTSFMPSYGMAEATLFITGGKSERAYNTLNTNSVTFYTDQHSDSIVSSGILNNKLDIQILNVKSESLVHENYEGEVIVAGESVMSNYWNKSKNEGFITVHDENNNSPKRYLRTGDLGVVQNGELFITGRLKEMLIIRGKNFLPYDIEEKLEESLSEINKNGVAISTISKGNEEVLLVVAEIGRTLFKKDDITKIFPLIIENVRQHFGLEVYDVVLIPEMYLPRTSSGKIQRKKAAELYLNAGFSKCRTLIEK